MTNFISKKYSLHSLAGGVYFGFFWTLPRVTFALAPLLVVCNWLSVDVHSYCIHRDRGEDLTASFCLLVSENVPIVMYIIPL